MGVGPTKRTAHFQSLFAPATRPERQRDWLRVNSRFRDRRSPLITRAPKAAGITRSPRATIGRKRPSRAEARRSTRFANVGPRQPARLGSLQPPDMTRA